MQSKSIATTEALSVSRVLPDGCLAYRHGLALPSGLAFDQWEKLGRTIAELAGSSQWLLGDWLAYGHDNFHGKHDGYMRVEHGIYSKIARLTGLTEGSLRNAKWVCAAVKLSCRHDKLTFGHALEIVARASANQREFWISKVANEEMSTKVLREELRKAKSTHKPEPNDTGKVTPLAITDQYVRDLMPLVDGMTPKQRQEHLTNLRPLIAKLSAA